MQTVKRLWSKHKAWLVPTALVTLLYLTMFLIGISCPIKFLSGISCPGCGMTRACLSALRLDFEGAFRYHPLWVAVLPALLLLLLIRKKARRWLTPILLLFALILVAVYIPRLLLGNSSVVVFEPENGFIYRQIKNLISIFR